MYILKPGVAVLAALATYVLAASVAINLHADWTDAPFPVSLVEAVASHDETLYLPTIRTLFGIFSDDDAWDDGTDDEASDDVDEEENGRQAGPQGDHDPSAANTHEGLYKRLVSSLTHTQKGFLDLNLINSIYSPRIQAHYNHYRRQIEPALEAAVEKQCAADSFGEPIADRLGAWVKYGPKVYCSEQDLYALQMDKTLEETFSFDRPIGGNKDAPLLVLYGNPESERFAGMLATLYSLADSGNLQFVWRYVPSNVQKPLELAGYGKTLLVSKKSHNSPKTGRPITSLSKFLADLATSEIYDVPQESLPHVSAMIASLVLEEPPSERFHKLSQILKSLPVYAPHLAAAEPPQNFEYVTEKAQANEKKGASRDLVGLSINGAMVHRLETDIPYIIAKLRDEVKLIEDMEELGFSKSQAKKLFSKFALLSAYKENEYRTGSANNRYALYKEVFKAGDAFSGGVVFFNDLSRDDNYNLYSPNRQKVYIQEASQFRHGQIPPLKENVHDIIFVLNFSNKSQLKVFFAMSKMILDKGIPQQLGVLPLVESEKDARITDMYYHILEVGEKTEALAFLYKYFDAKAEDEEALFELVTDTEKKKHAQYEKTLERFSITEPSVVINGVIVNMRSSNWQAQMGQQIVHDVTLLQGAIRQGDDRGKQLKDILYSGSKSARNLKITPKDPGNIRYKRITPELIEASVSFRKVVDPNQTSATFWLIGDCNSNVILDQLKQILEFMRQYNGRSTQVRILNTAKESSILNGLVSEFSGKSLTSPMLRKMVDTIGDVRIQTFVSLDPEKLAILENHQIQSHQSILLFNSRQFRLDSALDVRELQQILQYDFPQRLDTIDEVLRAYPEDFFFQSITDFKPDQYDDVDWYDMVTSLVTQSFNMEDSLVRTDVARFDFSSLAFENAIDLTGYDVEKALDILVVVDPVDEFSQRLVSIAESLRDLPFVNMLVLLQPLSSAEDNAVNRFYASGFVKSVPLFENGRFVRNEQEVFSVPDAVYRAGVDVPTRWQVVKNETANVDLDLLDASQDHSADFILRELVVEAFVKNVKNALPLPGLALSATNGRNSLEGITMETMGYNQMRLAPGAWELAIKNREEYELLSADSNRYIANDQPLDSTSLSVFSLAGNLIHVRAREASESAKNIAKRVTPNHADINVFSIASGRNYEKLMAIMMLSVNTHTDKTVKFWLLDEFVSSSFRAQLPLLAAAYDFQYELISYKWPIWLRQQAEPHRVVWAYKILFLDVLFPADLDRVIFVDADQIARTNLFELVQQDLAGAPYGFAPMCESRDDTAGFRFWTQGYWKTVLKDDLKYHISALFVVDLVQFRSRAVGDQLRAHYQKLSSDPGSLANLDQDLPNNLQRKVPIYTLAQEWLWCETWCSQASKKDAKMIDLCNDPTSSEPKIARAKRSIPEWTDYEKRLQNVGGSRQVVHDEL